jgi:mono/diheme cytochrome c family protein
MKPTRTRAAAIAILAMLSGASAQAEINRGQQLHSANCISCHTSMVGGNGTALYTRANRMVGSRDQLIAQVRRCESTLGLRWFDEDVMAVVEYLNSNFYRF